MTTATDIFPIPRECERAEGHFTVDSRTTILVPPDASEHDLFLARFLVAELSDRYGLGLRVERAADVPADANVVVMGAVGNPLVTQLGSARGLDVTQEEPGPEGYALQVERGCVLVAGSDEPGAFYGLQSLRQLIGNADGQVRIPCVRVRDWPHKTFRGIRLYLPGRDNLPFFRRFLRGFLALYKFNTLIVEMNACMRFDRHPELNAGWLELARDLNYRRTNRPAACVNSAHHDTADGGSAAAGAGNWWVVGDRELYGADAVACATAEGCGPATFFACEWRNPRLGKRIEEVRLRGAHGCRTLVNAKPDELIPSNAVVLAALSAVEKRT